jgi:molecular chaperone DnaK
MEEPLRIFCCYARKDQSFLLELKGWLKPLQRAGLITIHADIDISPGEEWEQTINHHLNTAHIVLLLISPDSLASEYCYGVEMTTAMERHSKGEARVIPIILRPAHFQRTPFSKLQFLPTDARPITNWPTHDDAFLDIINGIEKAIEEIRIKQETTSLTFQQVLGNDKRVPSKTIIYDKHKQMREDTSVKPQNITIFGIHLGTISSCISYVDQYGNAVIVRNLEGGEVTPSVVHFCKDTTVVVGMEAQNTAILSPDDTVEMVRRHLGDAKWEFVHNGKSYTAEEVSSYVLGKLAADATEQLGIAVKDVVLTCPAYFSNAQREALVRAGQIVGFTIREVLDEPTAVMIAGGLQNEPNQIVLLYDLGGSTFNVAVIEIKDGTTTIAAVNGDHLLGGHDWDNMIVKHLAEQWKLQTGLPDNPLDSLETSMELWFKAEKAKRTLSARQDVRISMMHAGHIASVTLTRVEFEELTAHLLDRTIVLARKTVNEAKKYNIDQIDQIILVGAATKMTQVTEQLRKEFGIPLKMLTSDGIVAKGAALYGYRLYSQGEKFSVTRRVVDSSITNVASHSIGIIVTVDADTPRKRKVIVNLILANDPLPISRKITFFTSEDNQEVMELELIENVKTTDVVELVDYSLLVTAGNVCLSLPPDLPAQSPIEVTFSLDQRGRLRISGYDPCNMTFTEATMEMEKASHG